MDKIFDFFYDLRDRVTNPLFSSFIIAWLLNNWKIPVGLIFYKGSELSVVGYKSYFELISNNLGLWNSFWVPLFYAVVYTFAFPYIRLYILAFLTFIKTKSTNWNLEIRKTGFVHVTKYIDVIKKYEDQTKFLAELIKLESITQNENMQLKAAAQKMDEHVRTLIEKKIELEKSLDSQKMDYLNEVNEITKKSTFNWLDGDWTISSFIKTAEEENKEIQQIKIEDGKMYEIVSYQKTSAYSISKYFFNPNTKEVFIIYVPDSDRNPNGDMLYHRLSYSNDKELVGMENENLRIEYIKIDSVW